MNAIVNLETILFVKYEKELSAEAWRTLLKFRLLSQKKEEPVINLTKESFYKYLHIHDDDQATIIWSELQTYGFVSKVYSKKNNSMIFKLNLKRIKEENEELTEEKTHFSTKFHVYIDIDDFTKSLGSKFDVELYIQSKLIKYQNVSNTLKSKFQKALQGYRTYMKMDKFAVGQTEIDVFFNTFDPYDIKVIEESLDVYNTNAKYWSRAGTEFINGILRNKNKEYGLKKIKEEEKEDKKIVKNEKAEIELEFALDLVLGRNNIEKDFRYELFIKKKDFKELNRYYQMGLKKLDDDNNNEEVRDYEWVN